MARVLLVGGGCRGRRLAEELIREGHVVRITTRNEQRRSAIEAVGAECWIGTPDRIGTLRDALAGVTIACWLLGTARGEPEQTDQLHGSRLQFMLGQLIDTTVRGFVYEAAGPVSEEVLADGLRRVRQWAELNAVPLAVIDGDPDDQGRWLVEAHDRVLGLLLRRPAADEVPPGGGPADETNAGPPV